MDQGEDSFASSIGLLIIAGIGFFIFNDSWRNSLWYSFKYNVGFGNVKTEGKPTDCDFLTAPLGIKNCSYKAYVEVYNSIDQWVDGDDAPLYRNDSATGKPIISYDNGQTWLWYTGTSDLKPHSVHVYWRKHQD